jgi:hypothetical protein
MLIFIFIFILTHDIFTQQPSPPASTTTPPARENTSSN